MPLNSICKVYHEINNEKILYKKVNFYYLLCNFLFQHIMLLDKAWTGHEADLHVQFSHDDLSLSSSRNCFPGSIGSMHWVPF